MNRIKISEESIFSRKWRKGTIVFLFIMAGIVSVVAWYGYRWYGDEQYAVVRVDPRLGCYDENNKAVIIGASNRFFQTNPDRSYVLTKPPDIRVDKEGCVTSVGFYHRPVVKAARKKDAKDYSLGDPGRDPESQPSKSDSAPRKNRGAFCLV